MWQRLLLPVVFLGSLVFALLSSVSQGDGQNFFWCWSAILNTGCALSLPFVYSLPYYRLARRMNKSGSALAGYYGAKQLSYSKELLICDQDLFPPGTIRLEGVKIISEDRRKVAAYAGIFPREKMLGDYSEAILSDSMRFFDNRIQGFMGQYEGRRGYVEMSVDWCGMFSEASREKFRILSAGRYWFDNYHRRFYGGYAFMMFHFAGSKLIPHCVNDNLTLNPYVGTTFHAYFDFDIKLHYIQTFQRDRDNEDKYRMPGGGMLQARMSKWGVFIDEQLYVGAGLQFGHGRHQDPTGLRWL